MNSKLMPEDNSKHIIDVVETQTLGKIECQEVEPNPTNTDKNLVTSLNVLLIGEQDQ